MKHKYITFREEDEDGRLCFFILQKAHPNFIGLLVARPVEGAIINVPIPNYNLWITFSGTLRGNYIPAINGVLSELSSVFYDMADFYYNNRVLGVKKYDKFKIKTNDTITG